LNIFKLNGPPSEENPYVLLIEFACSAYHSVYFTRLSLVI
jgi:hypothetical protein